MNNFVLPSGYELERAVPDDAQVVGDIRAANQREQYQGVDGVTPSWMDGQVERISGTAGTQARARYIAAALLDDAANHWLVVRNTQIEDRARSVVGFAEAREADGKLVLQSLHLRPEARGMHIGEVLLSAAVGWLRRRAIGRLASDAVSLEVAEINVAGQRFYRREGFMLTDRVLKPYGAVAMREMTLPGTDSVSS